MVCVSVVTVASLISPSEVPVLQNNITDYSITKKACPKSKINKVENNRICLKNGKVYRWAVKKNTIPTPIPTAAPTPTPTSAEPAPTPTLTPTPTNLTYTPPSVFGDNVENCKIKEVNLNGPRNGRAGPDGARISLPSGFPRVSPVIQHTGTVKWALIPIEFSDLKGDDKFRSRIDDQTKKLSDWYWMVSDGKLKIEWSVLDRWSPLPKSTSDYAISTSMNLRDSNIGQSLFRDAIEASDPLFDYSGIQQVIFILPKGQTFLKESSQGFPWDKSVLELRTQEGPVSGYSIAGSFFDQPGSEYWSYWAHEFGHSISLAHVGSSRGELPPFNPWDLMGGQDGPSKDLSGWLRFLIGWMDDSYVYCKALNRNKEITMTLLPLNENREGVRLAIFPLPSGKALLIESRRVTEFSCKTPSKWEGVLAYVYDPNLSHNEDFLVPISPVNRQKESWECNGSKVYGGGVQTSDVLLHKGDKITFEGVSVEVIDQKNLDRVVVKNQQ